MKFKCFDLKKCEKNGSRVSLNLKWGESFLEPIVELEFVDHEKSGIVSVKKPVFILNRKTILNLAKVCFLWNKQTSGEKYEDLYYKA